MRLFTERMVELRKANGRYSSYYLRFVCEGPKAAWEEVANAPSICRDPERIESARLDLAGLKVFDVRPLGRDLAGMLLPGAVGQAVLADLQQVAQEGCKLRLRVRTPFPELACWPWEFVFLEHDGQGQFLGTSPYLSLVRQGAAPSASLIEPGNRPIRALIVCVDTLDGRGPAAGVLTDLLSAHDGLGRRMKSRIKREYLGGGRITGGKQATLRNLQETLHQGRWDLLLYIGHGRDGGIALEPDAQGSPDWLSSGDLADLLAAAGIRVALLNMCDPTGSVGQVVAQKVSIVLAMQFLVTVPAATSFWRCFFDALACRLPIDECVGEARRWLESLAPLLRDGWGLPDWGTPVLYRGEPVPLPVPTRPGPARSIVERILEMAARLGQHASAAGLVSVAELARYLPSPAVSTGAINAESVLDAYGKDLWALLLAGEPGEAESRNWSDPLPLSALRTLPARLIWPRHPESQGYRVRILLIDELHPPGHSEWHVTDEPCLPWPPTAVVRLGQKVHWKVLLPQVSGQAGPWFQGRFRLLDWEGLDLLAAEESAIDSIADPFLRELARAQVLAHHRLYDEAVRLLRLHAGAFPDGAEGYAVRRLLAWIFKCMFYVMSTEEAWIGSELQWAGDQAALQTRLAYCAALGQLNTYKSGGCHTCGRCGLIKQGAGGSHAYMRSVVEPVHRRGGGP